MKIDKPDLQNAVGSLQLCAGKMQGVKPHDPDILS